MAYDVKRGNPLTAYYRYANPRLLHFTPLDQNVEKWGASAPGATAPNWFSEKWG